MKFRHSFIYLFILFFLRTYFSGKLELELETPSDLTEAKSLSQSYPKLKAWTSFIESITTSDLERGFLQNPEGDTEEEEVEEKAIIGEATQNMAFALEVGVIFGKIYFILSIKKDSHSEPKFFF